MKSKKSRIGRKFQALIPDLLTEREREEDRMIVQCSRSNLTTPGPNNHDLATHFNRRLWLLRQSKLTDLDPKRLYEQPISPSTLLNASISVSKEQYDRIVSVPRARHKAALESLRKKFLNRRTSRRRGMRCQNYKEWDERGFSDEQSEDSVQGVSPELLVDFGSVIKEQTQENKKRSRQKNGVKSSRSKKRHLSNQTLPDVIDLVDLSDSPEVTLCLMQSQRLPITISSPRRQKHTKSSSCYRDPVQQTLSVVKGDNIQKQSSPAVSANVRTSLGATSQHRQRPAFQPSQRIIGRISGFRPSSSNSKALIPVIEL